MRSLSSGKYASVGKHARTVPRFQYTIHIQFHDEDLFPSSWLNPSDSRLLLVLTGYFTFFPLISHTAIAFNRHTAIVWPVRHAKVRHKSDSLLMLSNKFRYGKENEWFL